MEPVAAKAHVPPAEYFEYTTRDAIIYALSVGARTNADLRYIYEMSEEFIPLPTFIVVPGLQAVNIMDWPGTVSGIGCMFGVLFLGVDFDLTRILHGEQYIEVFAPLPSEARLRSEARVVDILDKGSGALVLFEITTFNDTTGDKLAVQQIGTFQIGSGNFGGPRSSVHEKPAAKIPIRDPDAVFEEKTSADQAALYRMGSGDLNPLHIDPAFAKMSGFEQPILHGLCSMGFSARHIISGWAENDASKFKALKVRFTSPVIPGSTLRTETWKEGNRIIFQTKVKETGTLVIANAWMELSKVTCQAMVLENLQAKL